MSERGQKNFKLIVWIAIVILVVVKILRLADHVEDMSLIMTGESVTRVEWIDE